MSGSVCATRSSIDDRGRESEDAHQVLCKHPVLVGLQGELGHLLARVEQLLPAMLLVLLSCEEEAQEWSAAL